MPDRKKLKTRDITDVEILATGKWNPSTGGPWEVDAATLEEIAANFTALREVVQPPIKLGHDDGQMLLQSDGYPSAGWVDNVRKKGSKLVADLKKVPEKIADLIEAGGYRKVSVEVWKSMTVDGTVYSNVLTALALLGAELPAVSTLDDIVALYARHAKIGFGPGSSVRVAVVDAPKRRAELGDDSSLEDRREAIDSALREKYGDGVSGYGWPWIEETFDAYVIVTRDGRHWQIPYSIGSDGSVSLGTEVEVTQTWRPLATPGAGEAGDTDKEGDMADLKRIAKTLGLAETASEEEIVTAINASKPRKLTRSECEGMGGTWNDAEGTCKMPETADAKLASRVGELEKDNATLKTTLARRDAKDAVDAAIRAKKVAPAQREWAEGYAEKDPEGFKAYVAKTPEIFTAAAGSEADAEREAGADEPLAKFQAKVQEKLKADAKLDVATAQAQVSREEPELFRAAYGR